MAKRDPQREIGIDFHQNGQYEYIAGAGGQRELWLEGVRYEHCANDADGCWLYRRSSF